MVAYQCEVIIIGGGILGCWVLDELIQRGHRSSLLLEHDRLSCRQTGHSDAFLHQGYAYNGSSPAALVNSWALWNAIQPPDPPIPPIAAHHVYLRGASPTPTGTYTDAITWRNAQHPAVPTPLQAQTTHPDIDTPNYPHDAIQTNERCVAPDLVVRHFRDKHPKHFCKVARVEKITLAADPATLALSVGTVGVRLDDGTDLEIKPNILLLCAGEQNRDLLRRVQAPKDVPLPDFFNELDDLHKTTDMELMVIRDASGTLPLFNGSVLGGTFTDAGGSIRNVSAFVVSRREGQERVWVCAGGISGPQGMMRHGKDFRRRVIDHLSAVFPSFGGLQTRLEWGVYSGRLATMGKGFHSPGDNATVGTRKLHNLGIDRLLVCYTDRLTIAPLAASNIVATVAINLPQSGATLPSQELPAIKVNPDYWKMPLLWDRRGSMTWREFQLDCL
jgi:hypothetical protein